MSDDAMQTHHETIKQSPGESVPGAKKISAFEVSKSEDPVCLSIISNSRLLREGVTTLLSPHLHFLLIDHYPGEPVAHWSLPNPAGHIILLDSGVGRATALAWTRYWRSLAPPAYVLLLEMADDADLILACIEGGANGYVLKGASPKELAQAIHLVRLGKAQCSQEITARLFARVAKLKDAADETLSSASPLTPREMEVMHLIARGYSNKAIAAELNIELHTVKHHVHSILEKLRTAHRWDAARVAQEQGWLNSLPGPPRP